MKGIIFLGMSGISKLNTMQRLATDDVKTIVLLDPSMKKKYTEGDFHIYTDLENLDAMISEISFFVEKSKIDIITIASFSEFYMEKVALLCQYFGVQGPSFRAIKIARNKYLTKLVLDEYEDSRQYIPKFSLVRDAEDLREDYFEKEKKYIMKPLSCSASYGIAEIQSYEEAKNQLQGFKSTENQELEGRLGHKTSTEYLLLENFIEGFEISVESISVQDETRVYMIHDKMVPVEAPFFLEEGFVTDSLRISKALKQEIVKATKAILKGIGFSYGISHIEFKIQDQHPYLLEINARPGGLLVVESVYYSVGINLIHEYLRRISTGEWTQENKENNKLSAVQRIVYPSVGKITGIKGMDDLEKELECSKFLKEIQCACNVGDDVTTPEVAGHIGLLVAGKDTKQLLDYIEELVGRIEITTEANGL